MKTEMILFVSTSVWLWRRQPTRETPTGGYEGGAGCWCASPRPCLSPLSTTRGQSYTPVARENGGSRLPLVVLPQFFTGSFFFFSFASFAAFANASASFSFVYFPFCLSAAGEDLRSAFFVRFLKASICPLKVSKSE